MELRPNSDINLYMLIEQGHESRDLDYKAAVVWDERTDRRTCCGLAKDIMSIANSGGGYIVVGVAEAEPGHFTPQGLSPEQVASFESSRINRFVNNYASPPVNTIVRRVEYMGQTYVVIAIPGFPDTPHICQQSFGDRVLTAPTIYIRTANNESAPVADASDLRAVVDRALRNRKQELLTAIEAILSGAGRHAGQSDMSVYDAQIKDADRRFTEIGPKSADRYDGYLTVIAYPVRPIQDQFLLQELRTAAEEADSVYAGNRFIPTSHEPELMYPCDHGLEFSVTSEDQSLLGARQYFWRLHESGLLFRKELLWEEVHERDRNGPKTLSFIGLVWHAARVVDGVVRLYQALRVSDPQRVSVTLRLSGTQGRRIFNYDPHRILDAEYVSRMDVVEVTRSVTLAEWQADLRNHAVAISAEVFNRFGWWDPNPRVLRQIVDDVLDRRV